jgi:hypothetical protein
MTRILVYLNHLTLYYKRLGPQIEKYSEFKASPLLYKTPNFYKQSLRPLIKIDKENNSAKKISVELYEPFTLESWGILSQLGFICIVSIFLTIFQNEYKEEVKLY